MCHEYKQYGVRVKSVTPFKGLRLIRQTVSTEFNIREKWVKGQLVQFADRIVVMY